MRTISTCGRRLVAPVILLVLVLDPFGNIPMVLATLGRDLRELQRGLPTRGLPTPG